MPSGSNPPVLPPANDPGVAPGDPIGGFLDWLSEIFGPQAPIPVYPRGDRRNDMVIGPNTPNLDPEPAIQGGLNQLATEFHSAIVGLQEGLPIFGTFALLALVFLVGLVMFLESTGARPRSVLTKS